jgi:hypothetical protein
MPQRIEVEAEIPFAYAREAEEALKAWLAEERIRFIEEHEGQVRRFRPAPRDVKKRMLLEAELRGSGASASGRFELALSLGSKARLEPWLSRMSPAAVRAMAIQIVSIKIDAI